MAVESFDAERVGALDARLVSAAKGVKVLSRLGWPVETGRAFLDGWRAGRPEPPRVEYPAVDFSKEVDELEAVMRGCDRGHPLEAFIFRTARSYRRAAALLQAAGTPAFVGRSRELYGDPSQPVSGDNVSVASAALHVMDATAAFVGDCRLDEEDFCIPASTVADEMRRQASFFDRDPVEVVVDERLSSKAAAGARRVRLRGATCFSEADVPQLVHHELFVHTLTALNGRLQPALGSLGLGAPRTTQTQEGLALFAELITNSMDINRLRRIAARAVAIDMALNGAGFVEVFRYFLESGQTEGEACSSAARVFRGTDVRPGSAFTKDAVYFQGLVQVHRFLLDSARERRVDDPLLLMAGRMHAKDVARLSPWFRPGGIERPRYLPDWIRRRSRLLAFLLYSSVAAELHLDFLDGSRTPERG